MAWPRGCGLSSRWNSKIILSVSAWSRFSFIQIVSSFWYNFVILFLLLGDLATKISSQFVWTLITGAGITLWVDISNSIIINTYIVASVFFILFFTSVLITLHILVVEVNPFTFYMLMNKYEQKWVWYHHLLWRQTLLFFFFCLYYENFASCRLGTKIITYTYS